MAVGGNKSIQAAPLSNPAPVAPEADVEAIAEAEAVLAAEFGDGGCGLVEVGTSAAFGHEKDAFGGNGELVFQCEHFVEVGLA